MTSFDHIVVALRSPGDDQALLQYAARLVRLGGAKTVRLVHVADSVHAAGDLRDALRVQAQGVLGDLGVPVECDVLHGALTDRLVAYLAEYQPDLVLVGAKKRKLGARLAMVAPCSVAIVPRDHDGTLAHVLIATDFSDESTRALAWTGQLLARDRSVRCTALHVVTHESAVLLDVDGTARQDAVRDMLADAAARVGPGVEPRLAEMQRSSDVGTSHPFSLVASIEGSDVAHTILAEADAVGADCLVMGTRGRSASASILLGSVTEKVIERARVPVIIGKRAGRTLGLVDILLGHGRRDVVGVKAS